MQNIKNKCFDRYIHCDFVIFVSSKSKKKCIFSDNLKKNIKVTKFMIQNYVINKLNQCRSVIQLLIQTTYLKYNFIIYFIIIYYILKYSVLRIH